MTPEETRCANALFQQPWWLDAVAPGRWGEVTCERDGRIVARLPYVVRDGRGLRMPTQSSLTHTLGPWVGPKPTPTPPSGRRQRTPLDTRTSISVKILT